MIKEYLPGFAGEMLGTFILVFFGISAVAVSVLFSAHSGLFQVAMVWGIGVFIAIYCTRHLSWAHLNPAVSLAMVPESRLIGSCAWLQGCLFNEHGSALLRQEAGRVVAAFG